MAHASFVIGSSQFIKQFSSRSFRNSLIALLLLLCFLPAHAYAQDIKEQPDRFLGNFSKRIVRLRFYSSANELASDKISEGSGVLLDDGFVLTARHLLDVSGTLPASAKDIVDQSVFITGATAGSPAQLAYIADSDPDLLLLQYKTDIPRPSPPICWLQKNPAPQDEIASLGYQLGGNLNVQMGQVSSLAPNEIRTNNMNFTVGDSGAPVFDRDGYLAGIVSRELTTGGQQSGVFVIIPILRAATLLSLVPRVAQDDCPLIGDFVKLKVDAPHLRDTPNDPVPVQELDALDFVIRNDGINDAMLNRTIACLRSDFQATRNSEPELLLLDSPMPITVPQKTTMTSSYKVISTVPLSFPDYDQALRYWTIEGGLVAPPYSCVFTYSYYGKTFKSATAPALQVQKIVRPRPIRQ
ncbi:serine protease [Mesorhizobium sp. M1380]|uniref:S1 family peptidase n=1 Tax=Mesorhizobium sp. M1380 TaxID=2957093 RepID=UPI00333C8720